MDGLSASGIGECACAMEDNGGDGVGVGGGGEAVAVCRWRWWRVVIRGAADGRGVELEMTLRGRFSHGRRG